MRTNITVILLGLFAPVLICCNDSLQNQTNARLEFLLMGQAAIDRTSNPNAIGLMSQQQLCDRRIETDVNLSPSGNYLSAFQSTEFVPTLENRRTFEVMKVDRSFWGFGLENSTPLGWSMSGDTFHLMSDADRLLKLDPQSMEILEAVSLPNLGSILQKPEYLGFDSGVIAFSPSVTARDIKLIHLGGPTKTLTLEPPIEVTKLLKVTCESIQEVGTSCNVIFEARASSNRNSSGSQVIKALEYRISDDFRKSELIGTYSSPALVDGAYIGKMTNGDHLWLGYRHTFRTLYRVSKDELSIEIVSPVGDIFEAEIEDAGDVIVRGFDLKAARLIDSSSTQRWTNPVDGSFVSVDGQLPFLLSSLAGNSSQSRLYSVEDRLKQRSTFIVTKTKRQEVAVGCAENSYKGEFKTAETVKYVEFLPDLNVPRGIVFYLHGGPYSQQSLIASPMLVAWLKMGYIVWAIEPPGSVGFQFAHFLPTESYIREYFENSARLLVQKYTDIKSSTGSEVKIVYLGHSFGAFALMQIDGLLPKFPETQRVLINTPCRDFLKASTDRDLLASSERYRHAIQVGQAYQSLGAALSSGRDQCRADSSIATSIFASADDHLVGPSNSRKIARLSGLEVVTLDRQRHSLTQSGADFVVQTIDPLAPKAGASEHE